MLKVGIFGATGYAGKELANILFKHSKVKIALLSARIQKAQGLLNIFPPFKGEIDTACDDFSVKKAARLCEFVFLALPHTVSMDFAPELLERGVKVTDFSADYRLKDTEVYEKWYKKSHRDKKNLKSSVYGLPEIFRDKIKKAKLVANPGCYPTAALLAIAPLIKEKIIDEKSIIIDAKSGYSGAGRGYFEKNKINIVNNFKAYKVMAHQHAPEINQGLSFLAGKKIEVIFTPHLLPLERGILETIYLKATKKTSSAQLINLCKNFYKNEPLIRVREENDFPQIKDVAGKNFCDIGVKTDGRNIIIIAAIDNLRKGAASQAVQNMNIMCGFKETEGL